MRAVIFITIIVVLLFSCQREVGAPSELSGQPETRLECLGAAYTACAFTGLTAIPDNDPQGIVVGPVHVPGGDRRLKRVVLGLGVYHPYTGDLGISLHYDADRDGLFDAGSAVEVHLARLDACFSEELYGSPIELEGTYYFRDEGWAEYGESASFAVFRGLPGGGDFYLAVADTFLNNTGAITNWTVSVECSAIGCDEDFSVTNR